MTSPAAIADVVTACLDARGQEHTSDDPPGTFTFRAVATHGSWPVFVTPREESRLLTVHSLVDAPVPPALRPAVERYLTLANFGLPVGNFELDLEDGELRFKTSVDLAGSEATVGLVDRLLLANVALTNRYLPGIRAVLDGADPAKAVAEAEAEAS